MSPIIKVENLTRIFDVSEPWLNRVIERQPRALLTAVSEVSFEVPENSVYALVGESGSGKSTKASIWPAKPMQRRSTPCAPISR
jgi:peptide/nickel transport system ATP-binding protein